MAGFFLFFLLLPLTTSNGHFVCGLIPRSDSGVSMHRISGARMGCSTSAKCLISTTVSNTTCYTTSEFTKIAYAHEIVRNETYDCYTHATTML